MHGGHYIDISPSSPLGSSFKAHKTSDPFDRKTREAMYKVWFRKQLRNKKGIAHKYLMDIYKEAMMSDVVYVGNDGDVDDVTSKVIADHINGMLYPVVSVIVSEGIKWKVVLKNTLDQRKRIHKDMVIVINGDEDYGVNGYIRNWALSEDIRVMVKGVDNKIPDVTILLALWNGKTGNVSASVKEARQNNIHTQVQHVDKK